MKVSPETIPNPMNGFFLLDKPGGITSAAAVAGIKRILPRRTKVGHLGTLDPIATGVLPIAVGAATRLFDVFLSEEKEYRVTAALGARTDTYDADGKISEEPCNEIPEASRVVDELRAFCGDYLQTAPAFSARKLKGRRLYEYARSGIHIVAAPNTVRISSITDIVVKLPDVSFTVAGARGLYVRSLCNDLGNRLGCGAYMKQLRRNRLGPFHIDNSIPLDRLIEETQDGMNPAVPGWTPLREAIRNLPSVVLSGAERQKALNGGELPESALMESGIDGLSPFVVLDEEKVPVLLMKPTCAGGDGRSKEHVGGKIRIRRIAI